MRFDGHLDCLQFARCRRYSCVVTAPGPLSPIPAWLAAPFALASRADFSQQLVNAGLLTSASAQVSLLHPLALGAVLEEQGHPSVRPSGPPSPRFMVSCTVPQLLLGGDAAAADPDLAADSEVGNPALEASFLASVKDLLQGKRADLLAEVRPAKAAEVR